MRNNPVYRREMTVRARSHRIPVILMLFNGLLAAVALLNMYSAVAQVKISASIRYESFLQLYSFVAALEFLLLMFIMPALTSGSISGERERHTLELMFTTKIRVSDIVTGKLWSAFSQLLLLVVSSFPVLMLTLVYGSVGFADLTLLVLCYVDVALFTGAMGIFFSALMRRSTFSNVLTYGVLLAVVAGTYLLNLFLLQVSQMEVNALVLKAGEVRPAATSGWCVYLLLLNPVTTFAEILEGQIAGGGGQFAVGYFLGAQGGSLVTDHWIVISMALQTAFSAFFVWGAVRLLNPMRKMKRE